jgi:hypothetical protein
MTVMSIALVTVTVVLDLLDDVSGHYSVPNKIDASLMHFLEEALPFLIHVGHRAQVDSKVSRNLGDLERMPGPFQLVHPRPGKFPFDFEHG